MTRRDKILSYLKEKLSLDINLKGINTIQISKDLGIGRTNVSKELNILVRDGMLVKTKTRPVKYLFNKSFNDNHIVKMQRDDFQYSERYRDVFDNFIGKNGSLKTSIEKAKASILYPPDGLNVLITGPTGSGKTYFANAMYQFARDNCVITNPNLITFNCADYAHNPQLLMSHLFGYVKGAFTGADETTEGLVQKANGGILFLDEVHRLPPEGQEMIFYLIDHGTYSKLGETNKNHKTNIRLICATTENPESALLSTFIRRIPIIIKMPSLDNRDMYERLQLLNEMLKLEASRIKKKIYIDEDVMRALLGSVTYGNIGQLKSNVQLVCAQGFLNNIKNKESIYLHFEQLPQNIKDGLSNLASDREQLSILAKFLNHRMVITPGDVRSIFKENDDYELPYNLYEIIGDKATLLSEEGLDQRSINNFIMTDINIHLKSFYPNKNFNYNKNDLYDLVGKDIVKLTEEIQIFLHDKHYPITNDFLYAMSLHISSFIKRIELGRAPRSTSPNIISMVKAYPEELKYAILVKNKIEKFYRLVVPDSELYYLAILLVSLKENKQNGKVGIVVAAHGNSTASSMVHVVNKLLDADNLTAFDMPLDMNPKDALNKIKNKIYKVNRGNGVILLVDMGSLSTFDDKLFHLTGIKVKTIDMVTTSMVLETVRKSSLIGSDLETVYHSVLDFNGYSKSYRINNTFRNNMDIFSDNEIYNKKPKIILAICSTGNGTAIKIKKILDDILQSHLIDNLRVVPISVVDMKETIKEIKSKYQIIAVTGIVDPNLNVPFISLAKLLQGGGEYFISMIVGLIQQNNKTFELKLDIKKTKEVICKYLDKYFLFINPHKIGKILWNYCNILEKNIPFSIDNNLKVNLIIHLAGLIERILTQEKLNVDDHLNLDLLKNNKLYKPVLKANDSLERILNIRIPLEETFYIINLIDT